MPEVAQETAYYLNTKILAVALIAKGVRFPAGRWIHAADAKVLAWQVEEMLASVFRSQGERAAIRVIDQRVRRTGVRALLAAAIAQRRTQNGPRSNRLSGQ